MGWKYFIEPHNFFYNTLRTGGSEQLRKLLTDFEGYIRQIVQECVIISHYHHGISYERAFELTPFEKQIVGDFIQESQEREIKLRAAMFGIG